MSDLERQQQIEAAESKLATATRNEWIEKVVLTGDEARALAARLSGLQDTLAAKDKALEAALPFFEQEDYDGDVIATAQQIAAAIALNTDGEATGVTVKRCGENCWQEGECDGTCRAAAEQLDAALSQIENITDPDSAAHEIARDALAAVSAARDPEEGHA